ncbi:hypothetical protein KIN20_032514, partial [Parelaphostrongylus tenuis]
QFNVHLPDDDGPHSESKYMIYSHIRQVVDHFSSTTAFWKQAKKTGFEILGESAVSRIEICTYEGDATKSARPL